MNWFKQRWMLFVAFLMLFAVAPLIGQEVAAETGNSLLGMLSTVLTIVGPTLVGILTVPAFDLIKAITNLRGKLPAWAQQLLVPLLAYGLTWLGSLTSMVLPETLQLFTGENVSALLSAAMAFGIKAAQKK